MPDADDDQPRKRKRGWARARELDKQYATDWQRLVDEIISELGRPATAIDRIAIESIASAAVKARRLRAAGRDDLEQQRLIAQLLRATGLKPDKTVPQKPEEDFADEMRRLAMPKGDEE